MANELITFEQLVENTHNELMRDDQLKNIFKKKAFQAGVNAGHGAHIYGYKADDRRAHLRLLVDIWEEFTGEEYADTWVWIDREYHEGVKKAKKEIRKGK